MPTLGAQAKPIARMGLLPQPIRIAANILIAGLWLWLYRPVLDYLGILFSREEFRTNQFLALGVILLVAMRIRSEHLRFRVDAAPQFAPLPLALLLAASLSFLLVERFLDLNTLSATLCGLAGYGLCGLWMHPRQWRQGLPALLLLVGVLPFGDHLQTFVGYPMRLATAEIVRQGLSSAGVQSIGVDTILIFENGVSQVDIPCSGVKSLWTGALFLVAATWIERRPLNLRWLWVALVFSLLLFAANLLRVGVLVIVGQAAGMRLAAEMLHVPLGVVGFAAACAAAVALLRSQPAYDPAVELEDEEDKQQSARPAWLAPLLAAGLLALSFAYVPRATVSGSQAAPEWLFPTELKAEPLPLNSQEVEWLTSGGADSAHRIRFEWRGVTGSMIFVSSQSWRGHHRPERCFEVYGLSIDGGHTHLAGPDFPLRYVSLGYGGKRDQLSAVYWFQSRDRATEDYGTRIWSDLSATRERWILATILFDDLHNADDPDLQDLYLALRETVQQSLKEGG